MKNALFSFLAIILCFSHSARASHAQGADMSYRFVSYDSITGESKYIFTVALYRDCAGIPADASIQVNINDSSCGGTYQGTAILHMVAGLPCPYGGVSLDSTLGGCEVSHLCLSALSQSTCHGLGVYPGVQKYVYSDTVTFPGFGTPHYDCSNWFINIAISARNPSTNIVNAGSANLFIEATLNNSIDPATGKPYVNNSATFSEDPVPFACLGSPFTYNCITIDQDGDSLTYQLVNPLQNHADTLAFSPGYSAQRPVISSRFSFDPTTGQFSFIPSQTEIDVLAMKISAFRRGVLVKTIMRDVQIKIINCTSISPVVGRPAIVSGGFWADSNTVATCTTGDIVIDVPVSVTSGSPITLHSSIQTFPTLYGGFSFSQVGYGGAVTAHIVCHNIDSGCHYVYIDAGTSDCPIAEHGYGFVRICSGHQLRIESSGSVYCGTPISLYAQGDSGSGVWTPVVGLSAATGINTLASPTVNTWYHFSNSCGSDSVYIRAEAPIPATVSHDTSICNGNPVQLSVSVQRPGTYSYAWSPSAGLYDPAHPTTHDAVISNPLCLSAASHLYHCYITDSLGCVLIESVNVAVHGAGQLIIPSDTTVYAGAQVNLTAYLDQPADICSTIPTSNLIQSGSVQVGTATTVMTGTAFAYPSPYGNYYKSARHQMLFKASELNGLLNGSNIITSLSLDIGTLNTSVALHNFTIRVACTSTDSLTGYVAESSLQTVYSSNVIPVLGWNTHTFNQAYVWDGVSDLVVDICFTDTTAANLNSKMVYTTTPFRSIYWSYSNGFPVCGITGPANTGPYANYFRRPNAKFGVAHQQGANNSITWQPGTGVNAVSNPTSFSTSATPVTTQVYTVSLNDSLCPETDSLLVTVLPAAYTMSHTRQDSTLCAGDSIRLIAHGATVYSWQVGSTILSTDSVFYYTVTQNTNVTLLMHDLYSRVYTDTTHLSIFHVSITPTDTFVSVGSPVHITSTSASAYMWMDTSAVLSMADSVTVTALQSTDIVLNAIVSGCVVLDTCHISVASEHVWPGDANDDRTVDNNDILYLGLAFSSTGPVRPSASLVWVDQPAAAWANSFATGTNFAHADCDGNGVVDFNDTLAIQNNFSLSHPKTSLRSQGIYGLRITPDKYRYNAHDTIKATVSITQTVPHLYGIAYTARISAPDPCHMIGANEASSFISPRLIFKKLGTTTGYLAQSRTNHTDASGSGNIDQIEIVIDAALTALDSAYLTIDDVLIIDKNGDTVSTESASTAIVITNIPLSLSTISTEDKINVYPNPNNGSFKITKNNADTYRMRITDEIGRTILERDIAESATLVDLSRLSDGIYTASFSSPTDTYSRRIVIRK
jgi:hypothetical protein